MNNGFWKLLGYTFSGIIAFCALNSFLFILGGLQRWDYILANSLLIILIYFTYLTYEIQKIKESLKPKKEERK